MTREQLLSLAASVHASAPVAQRICAAGIRENLTSRRGTMKRAQEAGVTLQRLQQQRSVNSAGGVAPS